MSTSAVAPLAAPRIPAPSTAQGKWQREYQAFLQQLPDLLATHRNRYVVVHEGQVVDSGTDDLALALQFFAKHGSVPVHVGLVTDQAQAALRVPHYREKPRPGEATCWSRKIALSNKRSLRCFKIRPLSWPNCVKRIAKWLN